MTDPIPDDALERIRARVYGELAVREAEMWVFLASQPPGVHTVNTCPGGPIWRRQPGGEWVRDGIYWPDVSPKPPNPLDRGVGT